MEEYVTNNDFNEGHTSYLAAFLFFLEFYHFIGHSTVLLRIRMLPRKDLVRQKYYFLFDTLTVAMTNFVYTGQLRWLAAIQMFQHLFFVFTWNKHPYTKKVISWSSLDWKFSDFSKGWHWHLVLGTAFDTMVHAVNCYLLSLYMTREAVMVCMVLSFTGLLALVLNSRLAWSSPQQVPKWIEKRIQPVKNDQYAFVMELWQFTLFCSGVGIIYYCLF